MKTHKRLSPSVPAAHSGPIKTTKNTNFVHLLCFLPLSEIPSQRLDINFFLTTFLNCLFNTDTVLRLQQAGGWFRIFRLALG